MLYKKPCYNELCYKEVEVYFIVALVLKAVNDFLFTHWNKFCSNDSGSVVFLPDQSHVKSVCLFVFYSGFTSLSTIFQSYRDSV